MKTDKRRGLRHPVIVFYLFWVVISAVGVAASPHTDPWWVPFLVVVAAGLALAVLVYVVAVLAVAAYYLFWRIVDWIADGVYY